MKTNRFLSLLAVFAIAFTFSACAPTDDDDSPTSSSSGKQDRPSSSSNGGDKPNIPSSSSDGGDKLSIPSGYDNSKVVILGGTSNTTEGSFLDADGKITVYKSAEAPKDKIDLVFDGTRLFVVSYYDTPAGASALGNAKLKGGETAIVWAYTGDESPDELVDFIYDRADADDYGSTTFVPKAGNKYAVFTTDGFFAIVKVDEVNSNALKASVGNLEW